MSDEKPSAGNIRSQDELAAIAEAWVAMHRDEDDEHDALERLPIVGTLFAAAVGDGFEPGEVYHPAFGLLRSLRTTIDNWASRQSPPSYQEFRFAVRRIDVLDRLLRHVPAFTSAEGANDEKGGAP